MDRFAANRRGAGPPIQIGQQSCPITAHLILQISGKLQGIAADLRPSIERLWAEFKRGLRRQDAPAFTRGPRAASVALLLCGRSKTRSTSIGASRGTGAWSKAQSAIPSPPQYLPTFAEFLDEANSGAAAPKPERRDV